MDGKRVAVVGDSDLICRAIKLALHRRLKLPMAGLSGCGAPGSDDRGGGAAWDLLIVAVTSESSEPIAELAKSFLIDWVGTVPLLIISSRPFESSPEFRISHIRFPFDPEHLCDRVRLLLHGRAVTSEAAALA